MKRTYQVFAYLIAVLVLVQAALIVYAISAFGKYISDGATMTPAMINDQNNATYPGAAAFGLHWFDGALIIPVVAIIFLIISFFAKISGGTKWALSVFGLLVVQVALGFVTLVQPGVGWLHGVNAFLLFSVAVLAGYRVQVTEPVPDISLS